MDQHQQALLKLCRICGSLLSKTKKVPNGYKCVQFVEELKLAFGVDVTDDTETIHPTHFCHSCRGVVYSLQRAQAKDREYRQCRVQPFQWEEHSRECVVCEQLLLATRGGRPRKSIRPGRPPKLSPKSAISHVKAIAPESLADTQLLCIQHSEFSMDLTCAICLNVVDKPVELSTCSSLVCAECCCEWLRQIDILSFPLSCPCCHDNHFDDFSTIRQPGALTLKLLKQLIVTCNKCEQSMKLEQHHAHITSGCSPVTLPSPDNTIQNILSTLL